MRKSGTSSGNGWRCTTLECVSKIPEAHFRRLDLHFCVNIDDFEYIKTVCEIISWNIWQMDGLTGCPPYVTLTMELKKVISNINKERGSVLFNSDECEFEVPKDFCRIMDWDENKETTYAEVYAAAVKVK